MASGEKFNRTISKWMKCFNRPIKG